MRYGVLTFMDVMGEKYGVCRKTIMKQYQLSTIEVDVILFLANHPGIDTAGDVVRLRKISKSHVSLAVKGLLARGYLSKEQDQADHKLLHLKITPQAAEMVAFGQKQQQRFMQWIFGGFTEEEKQAALSALDRIIDNTQKEEL